MQDWSKFAWKKGDVLESDNKLKRCIFEEWANDDYTDFNCFAMDEGWNDYFSKINNSTCEYHKADDFVTELHIKRVEKKFGGKLNLKTLEIEKQTKFKDGDIITIEDTEYKAIIIYKSNGDCMFRSYAVIDNVYKKLGIGKTVNALGRCTRLATNSEKQQLFSALEKEGKRWNPVTKQIEDLPKKCEFKPFDKVLVRDYLEDKWMPNFFSFYDGNRTSEYKYGCIAGNSDNVVFSKYCIPYNEETAHLLGTTDEWKGGEG